MGRSGGGAVGGAVGGDVGEEVEGAVVGAVGGSGVGKNANTFENLKPLRQSPPPPFATSPLRHPRHPPLRHPKCIFEFI